MQGSGNFCYFAQLSVQSDGVEATAGAGTAGGEPDFFAGGGPGESRGTGPVRRQRLFVALRVGPSDVAGIIQAEGMVEERHGIRGWRNAEVGDRPGGAID